MSSPYRDLLDAAWETKPLNQVLEASPEVLQGVGPAAAQKLAALGIHTVRDLGTWRYAAFARALLAGAGEPPDDPGPPEEWVDFFGTAPLGAYLAHARFRKDFGPVWYRGRLDGTARVLVVGQDPSTDEVLAQRVFIGHSGQRVQGLLAKLGLARGYAMLNVFLFGITGQMDATMEALSLSDPFKAFRNAFLDRLKAENPLEAVLAIGKGARLAVQAWPGRAGLHVAELVHPAAPDEAFVTADWNAALPALLAAVEPEPGLAADPALYGAAFAPGDIAAIPRHDLPFGIPSWHGSGGTRSHRPSTKEILWGAP